MSEIVNTLPYSADLSKSLDKTDLHTLFVMGDNQAHRFELEILSGSKAVDLTGATVTGYFTNFKEDTTVTVPGKVEGGKAVVVLTKPCYTLHGQFVLAIQVKSGEVEDTVFLGEGFMRRTKGETIIYDDYIVYDVNTLLAQISAMKTATENANAATTKATNAASAANTAAGNANTNAQAAQTAADAANAAAQNWSNGTAANAIQLNGKDAKHYSRPRNLLDNSWFGGTLVDGVKQDMVAQAGFNALHSTTLHLADRWKCYADSALTPADGYITITKGAMWQRVKGLDATKTYTYAVMGLDGNIRITTGSPFVEYASDVDWGIVEGDGIPCFRINTGSWVWAALYEGEYTADNLPPYTPKGYAAEMAECRRYYQVITYDQVGLTVVSQRLGDGFRGSMQIDPMRINAPTATMSYTNTIIAAGGTNINIAEMTATVNGTTLSISGTAETALISGGAGLLYGNLTGNKIEISADL